MDPLKTSLILGLILTWTINPFFKRRSVKTLSGMEYFIVNLLLSGAVAIPVWMYLIKTGSIKFNVFQKMSSTELKWAWGSSIITIISSIMLVYLVKNYEVSSIIPQVQPMVILLSVLMGAFLFGESLSRNKLVGVALIIAGMVVINMTNPVKIGKRPWKLGA